MFLNPAKPGGTAPRDVEFTAKDLDDTIALHRRISRQETRLARAFDEMNEYAPGSDYGRLPAGVQGPHSPTD
ncbi:MAG TPA: hypothetical protein VHN20_18235 [Beijerinckiaceae bacterium]|nr:hypothetical protein [Beijerinckiaceae bacterium]